MRKQSIDEGMESRVCFEELETQVRAKIQRWVQDLLEEEVTELLGREKSERRAEVDSPAGYRNGYGKPRRLTMQSGTVTVHRPRVRGLEGRFESRILPLFSRRTKQVGDLLPELYLHGLAQGDFDLALRGLLGEEAPLSASTVARLKAKWDAEHVAWRQRSLADLEVVYLWVDGLYVKAGLEKEKAALLVVLAALSDGRKEFLCIESGYRESTESWAGGAAGFETAWIEMSSAGDWRRPPGDLGRVTERVPRGRRATVLESPDSQRAGQGPQKATGTGPALPEADSLCGHPQRSRATQKEISGLVSEERIVPGRGLARRGLGADGGLLPLSQIALAARSHHQPGGIPLLRCPTSHQRR